MWDSFFCTDLWTWFTTLEPNRSELRSRTKDPFFVGDHFCTKYQELQTIQNQKSLLLVLEKRITGSRDQSRLELRPHRQSSTQIVFQTGPYSVHNNNKVLLTSVYIDENDEIKEYLIIILHVTFTRCHTDPVTNLGIGSRSTKISSIINIIRLA